MQPNILSQTSANLLVSTGFEYIVLGSTPNDEECTQVGESIEAQLIECRAYINQLRRVYGPEPAGATFFILKDIHPAGIYHIAAIAFAPYQNKDDEGGESPRELYALQCEKSVSTWDEDGIKELTEQGHPKCKPANIAHENI